MTVMFTVQVVVGIAFAIYAGVTANPQLVLASIFESLVGALVLARPRRPPTRARK
ncbi:MAG: hypothetical protein ACYDAQ_21900 [Mycobacteriales bacterium]